MRSLRAVPLAFALSLFLAPRPCSAYLREFIAKVGDARVAGAEVCFYRAAGFESATALFFSHAADVGCLAADRVVDMPAGTWTFFVRKPGLYTSTAQAQLVSGGDPRPEEDYSPVAVPMHPAAVLDVTEVLRTCKAACEVGVWVDSSGESVGTYIPLIPGEQQITVPADSPFVPLVIVNGRVTAIGKLTEGRPRQRLMLPPFESPRPGTSNVVASVKANGPLFQLVRAKALRPPRVAIAAGDRAIEPLLAIGDARAMNDRLLFFKDVPAGMDDLTLSGPLWERETRRISAAAGGVTIIDEPLVATPAAAVRVDWTLHGAPPSIVDDSCAAAPEPSRQRVSAALLDCHNGSAACSELRVVRAEPGKNEIVFEGVPAGKEYIVSVTGLGDEARQTVVARLAEETAAHVEAHAFIVSGRVRRGTSAAHARVTFSNGGAISNTATGVFTAFLPAQPWNNVVAVRPCAGDAIYDYVADSIAPGTTLAIDLPDTETTVKVSEPDGKPVAEAIVRVSLMKGDPSDGRAAGGHVLTTSKTGVAQTLLSSDQWVTICAEKKEYQRVCLQPARFTDREISIVLKRSATVFTGKLLVDAPATGRIAAVNPAGIVTEQTHVSAEGEFTFLTPHTADDYLVYLSPFHPLAVVSGLVWTNDETLEIALPGVPIVQSAVHLGDACSQESAVIGLWMDGRYIPLDLFAAHQSSRGSDVFLGHGRTLVVAALAAQSATVALGPDTAHMTGLIGDPFVLPEYRSVRKVPLVPGRAAELCAATAR